MAVTTVFGEIPHGAVFAAEAFGDIPKTLEFAGAPRARGGSSENRFQSGCHPRRHLTTGQRAMIVAQSIQGTGKSQRHDASLNQI